MIDSWGAQDKRSHRAPVAYCCNVQPASNIHGAECDSAPESSERALEIVLTIAKIYWKNEKNRPSPPKKKIRLKLTR